MLLLLSSVAASLANAQLSTTVAVEKETEEKKFALALGIVGVSSLKPADEADYEAGLELEARPSYKINRDFSLGLTLSGTQELNDERLFVVDDGAVGLSYAGVQLADGLTLAASASAAIPLSEASLKMSKRWTSLSLGPSLSADVGKMAGFSAVGLSLSYALTGYRSIHEYTTSADGKSLSPWAVRHTLSADVSLQRFTLSLLGAVQTTWTYGGVMRSSYRHEEQLAFAITPQMSATVGHRLDWQSVLAPDGQSANYAVFDGLRSQLFAGLSYVF